MVYPSVFITMSDKPLSFSLKNRDRVATFKVNDEVWSKFKEECVSRGVSVCHVMEMLMQGWIEGQKVMSTVIQPVNMTINMQHIVKRPRRMIEISASSSVGCEKLTHANWLPAHIGWCRNSEKWVRLEDCNYCVKRV